jgi:CheY-like chemotaxis protein
VLGWEREICQIADLMDPMLKSILLIEDDLAIRTTISTWLEIEGYQVFTARNGREALEKLVQIGRPKLILLDIMMPQMNGWAFLEEFEKNVDLASIPVVILSAFKNTAFTMKPHSVIEKPIQYDTLIRVVEKYCA